MRTHALSVTVLLALAATAHAQRAPDMATLDRGDGITKVGIDLGYSFLEHPPYDGALRLEPYGQYVLDSGFGFYGALPISISFGPDNPEPLPDDTAALGNLELGLLYILSADPAYSFVFRGGVALPTAADDRDGIATNFSSTFPRFTDLALAYPDAVYLRLAISPLVHTGSLFLRADLGFDIGLDNDAADELLRLNVAGGVDLDVVALSLELVNTVNIDSDDDEDEWAHTLAVTVRFMGEQLQPFISVGTPLDDDFRDRVDLFLSAGLVVAF